MKRAFLFLTGFILLCSAPAPAAEVRHNLGLAGGSLRDAPAAEHPWKLQKNHEGIRVFTRTVDGSAILEFRAETEIRAPLEKITGLYEEAGRMSEWFYRCKEAKLLKRVSAHENIVYFAADLPWPLSDRDGVYKRVQSAKAASGAVIYKLSAASSVYPLQKGRVRVKYLDAEWHFTPRPDGTTAVYYRMHTSAGGFIPPAVVNRFTVSLPFKTLLKLRALLESSR